MLSLSLLSSLLLLVVLLLLLLLSSLLMLELRVIWLCFMSLSEAGIHASCLLLCGYTAAGQRREVARAPR